MKLSLLTAPAAEPLLRDEVKIHLRVDGTSEDTHIDNLIKAWRSQVDGKDGNLNRALITQTWKGYLNRFPSSSRLPIVVPLAPLASVTHIKYYDTNGDLQTWAGSNYILDVVSEPGLIYPAYNTSWPSTRDIPNAVEIQFVAGYGAAGTNVPQAIRQAGLLTIGHWYANRESVNVGNIVTEMPQAAKWLLSNFKVLIPENCEAI